MAFFQKKFSSRLGFLFSLFSQVNIGPTGKPVFQIPLALAMS
jgi:hypothetical protein